jgi:phosphatidylinositol alpha-1,6-mannosyltransferase
VLFISRGWTATSLGGLERYARELIDGYPDSSEAIVMHGGRMRLLWFLPMGIVRGMLRARHYDRIHGTDAISGMAAAVIGRLSGRPWGFTAHGLDIVWAAPGYQLIIRRLLKAADLVVANSTATFTACVDRGAEVNRVTVVSPGVGTEDVLTTAEERRAAIDRLPADLADWIGGRCLLFTIGRLVPRKGVRWFIETVMPSLESDVVFLVAGEGSESEGISEAIDRLGLSRRVRLLGRVNDSQRLSLLARCDAFVMPNLNVADDMEGFGIVALEAGGAGAHVLASETEGIRDALAGRAGTTGVRSGDAQAWRAATRAVLESDPVDQQSIVNGVARGHLWSEVVFRYIQTFGSSK